MPQTCAVVPPLGFCSYATTASPPASPASTPQTTTHDGTRACAAPSRDLDGMERTSWRTTWSAQQIGGGRKPMRPDRCCDVGFATWRRVQRSRSRAPVPYVVGGSNSRQTHVRARSCGGSHGAPQVRRVPASFGGAGCKKSGPASVWCGRSAGFVVRDDTREGAADLSPATQVSGPAALVPPNAHQTNWFHAPLEQRYSLALADLSCTKLSATLYGLRHG